MAGLWISLQPINEKGAVASSMCNTPLFNERRPSYFPRDSSKAHLLSEGELHRRPFGYGQFTVGHEHHLIVLICYGAAIRISDGHDKNSRMVALYGICKIVNYYDKGEI